MYLTPKERQPNYVSADLSYLVLLFINVIIILSAVVAILTTHGYDMI